MRVSRSWSRAIGMGLVFAFAGFSYAVATGQTQNAAVGSRAVGVTLPLNFANSNVYDAAGNLVGLSEYDLGDAAFAGSLVRYVDAIGGLKPYRFTSVGTQSLAVAIANTSSSLTLGLSGVLSGFAPASVAPKSTTILGTPGLRFQVTVTDAKPVTSSTKSGFFNLQLFNSATTPFRFAVDTLPNGSLDAAYITQLDVLGANGNVLYSSAGATNTADGTLVPLDQLGLFLTANGAIYGRPLATGTYTIVVRATDSKGNIAGSRRNPGVPDQMFTLTIADNPVTSSDTMTTQCTVTGDSSTTGGDSLRVSSIINVLGGDRYDLLNSTFSFQLGSITVSGQLDKNGRLKQQTEAGNFTVDVSAKAGTLTIQGSHGTFVNAFGSFGVNNGDTVRRPLKIVLGDAVDSCEVLDFAAAVSDTKYQYSFRQGNIGQSASGGFQLVKVHGRDGIALTGEAGDAWQANFVALPRAGVTNPNGLREGLDDITAINIRVGANFAESFTGANIIGAGPNIHFVGGPVDGVNSFALSTITSKGSVVLRTLPVSQTGIPTAGSALGSTNLFFDLGVDVTRLPKDQPYVGEHARLIFNYGKQYSDNPPTRGVPPIY